MSMSNLEWEELMEECGGYEGPSDHIDAFDQYPTDTTTNTITDEEMQAAFHEKLVKVLIRQHGPMGAILVAEQKKGHEVTVNRYESIIFTDMQRGTAYSVNDTLTDKEFETLKVLLT